MANYVRLAALLGPARVKDIIFTGRLIDAEEARAIGLLSEVLPDYASLQKRADELAQTVAAPCAAHLARHQGGPAPDQGKDDARGGSQHDSDVLHEPRFSRRHGRIPEQAHAQMDGDLIRRDHGITTKLLNPRLAS